MQKQTKRTISGFILIMFGVILCILPVLVSADEVYSLTINYEV